MKLGRLEIVYDGAWLWPHASKVDVFTLIGSVRKMPTMYWAIHVGPIEVRHWRVK